LPDLMSADVTIPYPVVISIMRLAWRRNLLLCLHRQNSRFLVAALLGMTRNLELSRNLRQIWRPAYGMAADETLAELRSADGPFG
jgi:hypothetical protein